MHRAYFNSIYTATDIINPIGETTWDLYEYSPCKTIPQEFECSSILRPIGDTPQGNGYYEIIRVGGNYNDDGYGVGTVVRFRCNTGYIYEGPETSMCTNRDWTYLPGICTLDE